MPNPYVPKPKKLLVLTLIVVLIAGCAYYWNANRNAAILDERWALADESSELTVDHKPWQALLDDYLITDDDSAVNLFDYEGLLDDDRDPLDDYVNSLLNIDPLTLNSTEQKAYWINLYNSLTVQLIIDHYPMQSITDLGTTVGSFGPWDDEIASVNRHKLSLNDIEHRIIRPLYNDHRIHFAVNCASIGCPDLAPDAYTADTLDAQLTESAKSYLQHERGLSISADTLRLSTLFKWYADDFGDDLPGILTTLTRYTTPEATTWLKSYIDDPEYIYDWSLNGLCHSDQTCSAGSNE